MAGSSFWVQGRRSTETLADENAIAIGAGGDVENDQQGYGSYIGVAGTLSVPWVRVATNTLVSVDCTLTLYVNGSSTGCSVTIPASGNPTGAITGTGTASVSVGDYIEYVVSKTDAGSVALSMLGIAFTPTTSTQTLTLTNTNSPGSTNYNGDSATTYFKVGGNRDDRATESEVQFEWPFAGTASYFYGSVAVVARTTTCTARTRINGSDGNSSFTWDNTDSFSRFVDSSNTETISARDIVDFSLTNGTGSGEANNIEKFGWSFVNSSGLFTNFIADEYVFDQNDGLTVYYPVGGNGISPAGSSTESDVEYEIPFATNITELYCRVVADIMTDDTVLTLRKNGSDVGSSLTVNAVGYYELSQDVDYAEGDTISIKVVTGASGTRIRFGHIGIVATETEGGGVTVSEMYVKTGGVFAKHTPNIKVGGVWQEVDAYVKSGGVWVQVHQKP